MSVHIPCGHIRHNIEPFFQNPEFYNRNVGIMYVDAPHLEKYPHELLDNLHEEAWNKRNFLKSGPTFWYKFCIKAS